MTERYLGTGHDSDAWRPVPLGVPAHLPARLSITLWDFSWYTRAGEGEPYDDLDRACADAADLGYNCIRICAAPLLLFGHPELSGLARDLEIEGLGAAPDGGYYGRGTRWYDVPGGYRIDVLERLHQLLEAAKRHGLVVILASWEYQQSTSFARSPRWFDAIDAVPLTERYDHLAAAWGRLIDWVTDLGLRSQIAMVELHNEVDFSILPALAGSGERALRALRRRHPDLLITASYGKPPHLAMHQVSDALGAAQFHVYSYGVLDALQKLIDIRSEQSEGFPNAMLRSLLVDDAPTFAEYGRPAEWKLRATVVTDQMIYGYDWVDPGLWDAWLSEHAAPYRLMMRREIESRVSAVAAWAHWKRVPAVIGEGWLGYTPLNAWYEESEHGLEFAECGVDAALRAGVWGVVLCSNAAPHHPMWQLRDWQRSMNERVLASGA